MQAGAVLQNASAADRRAAVVRTCETLDQALDRAWPRADQDARARALRIGACDAGNQVFFVTCSHPPSTGPNALTTQL